MTRMTMAALPIVDDIEGASAQISIGKSLQLLLSHLHIPMIFAVTLLPNERQPVIATRRYMKPDEVTLAITTEVVLDLELSAISFNMENIWGNISIQSQDN